MHEVIAFMEIYANTTIYIASIPRAVSGGPELLHQLCSDLLRRGLDARLWYPTDDPTPEPTVYRKYHVPYTTTINPSPENILIFPETMAEVYPRLEGIRKVLWWLSVDNYMGHLKYLLETQMDYFLCHTLRQALYVFSPDAQMEHWVQSEYARRYVRLNGVPDAQVHFVGDYLQSGTHIGLSGGGLKTSRNDIIAYNPRKGMEFTKELMAAAPDLAWTPIEDMTAAEVHDLLSRAKVYIDFGNHPGQDRIPREAAAAGCCIITGQRGAAANDIDIPIPSSYKFPDDPQAIPAILACLRACLADYEGHIDDFAGYRAMIAGQKAKFRQDIAAALPVRYDVPKRQHVILREGPHVGMILPALMKLENLDLIGLWTDQPDPVTVHFGGQARPGVTLEEITFLDQEGRLDAVFFEPGAEKEAAGLKAAGLKHAAIRWLRW